MRCLNLRVGFSCSSGPDSGLLSDPVAPFLEETIEVPMRVGSSSSLSGLSTVDFFPVFPRVFSPEVSWIPLTGLVDWLLLAPRSWNPPSRPLQSLASSHSGVCAIRVGVPPFVPSLPAALLGLLPSGLAIASLPLVSRPWTVLSWSHLMSLSSGSDRLVVVPRQLIWLRGVFPCFDHLPSFSRYEAAFLRVLCFDIAPSLCDEVTLPGRVCLSPRS